MKKITLLPRPDNKYRTQEGCIELHNKRKESMISLPNVVQIVEENNTQAIENLREDFDDWFFITSSQVVYNALGGKVINNAGSEVVKQTEIVLEEIPVCRPAYISNLLQIDAGLKFVRALINKPKATIQEIEMIFVALSGKQPKDIRFWTPTLDSRKSNPVRCVGLYFGVFDRFVVDADGSADDVVGFSRGVIVPSAKQTKIFSRGAIFDLEKRTVTLPLQKKYRKEIEKKIFKNKKVKINWDLKIKTT